MMNRPKSSARTGTARKVAWMRFDSFTVVLEGKINK